MKKKIIRIYLILGIFSLVLIACTKDIDFNQVDDFEVSPVVESSLIFMDEPANQFYENGIEVTTVQDSVLIDIFRDNFIREHLTKAEFVFETTNSIDREFELQVDFLTDSNVQLHTFSFSVSASPNNAPLTFNYTEVFEDNELISLLETEKLVFTLNLQSGTVIDNNTPGSIKLKSKGVFYLTIDDSL